MIESIIISKQATYQGTGQTFNGLKKLNYVFGCNGSGKTTISRIIAEETSYPSCTLHWQGGTRLQTLVYNRDFVEKNFSPSSDLKGVYTLGEENIDAKEKIDKANAERKELEVKISSLNLELKSPDGTAGKEIELADLDPKLKDECWKQKLNHDANFKDAFEGFRNNAEKFKDKVLAEAESNNYELLSFEDLVSRAETVFGETPSEVLPISDVSLKELDVHQSNSILGKRVIGKDDVDIASMIKKLGNSDWVREGLGFYEKNDEHCPFCQQKTDEAFAQSLNEYFDESFETDSRAIDELIENYTADAERIQKQLTDIITESSKFLDIEKFEVEKILLDSNISINKQKLEEKKKEPSSVVVLEDISSISNNIQTLIKSANEQISKNNQIAENIKKEREKLKGQVWKFIVEELKTEIEKYKQKNRSLNTDIQTIKDNIKNAKEDEESKIQEIRALEKKITSIQPTLGRINSLLQQFGFDSFLLRRAKDESSYRLVRRDGSCAKETLSEGEKSFVMFLYFFHLLEGSYTSEGTTSDKVVVFDDPVSSLDSDILFIVSNLIKEVCEKVRSDAGRIKQVFILTHNVYFHKEVTYHSNRLMTNAFKDETFWIVRKNEGESKIEKCDNNPINTSYELLWLEVKNAKRAKISIPNTLRRILEHYFKILGHVNFNDICKEFQGHDKVVCKSLFTWIHAGSHGFLDDLHISDSDVSGDVYLRVFQEIFVKAGHEAHYKMMLGKEDTSEEQDNDKDISTVSKQVGAA